MSLSSLPIKPEYRSLLHRIAEDFLIPALREASAYDRAVGFFSSSVLSQIADGIEGLIRNGGKIRLIASPYLSAEDLEAIRTGYQNRDHIIRKVLSDSLQEPQNFIEQENLNLLANLISDGYLDIKIAFTENTAQTGMYHEKLGIIKDADGNTIAFSGSMNESENAFINNYEAIDVFCSWKHDEERIQIKEQAFASIWNNTEPNIVTMDFPEIKEEIMQKYHRRKVDYSAPVIRHEKPKPVIFPGAAVPDDYFSRVREYQQEAIEAWKENGYCGIFNMATGTGKTYTALGAIAELNQNLRGKLAVVIVCPYQHLVEQWTEDIEQFHMKPIIGYSASRQKDWKQRLEKAVRLHNMGIEEFFCFICTNATYASAYVQEHLKQLQGKCLFVADEAHNLGAKNLSVLLHENFSCRLALSATLERHHDAEGTNRLRDYFGKECITYDLERAIREGMLTRYLYYPVIVYLTEDELKKYYHLTKEIITCLMKDKAGNVSLNEKGKRLCLQRARIVAAAKNKLEALRQQIAPLRHENHILVYCGAASLHDYTQDDYPVEDEDLRQIDAVTDLLGNQLDMLVSQYTSRENIEERCILKEQFALGQNLQALIAIKCLDEGVNIPSIKTAFILASTANPKEYIQRRGRVLRLYEEKDFAVIYDFITLPKDLNSIISATETEINMGKSLVRSELTRAFEFARLADNFAALNRQLEQIREAYDICEEEYSEREEFEAYVN